MVGLVLVSHSARLAEGVAELAAQMGGAELRIGVAGGLDQPGDPLGTDATSVVRAIDDVWSEDGVLVLMDLGSAVLSADLALELLTEERRGRVLLTAAPLVEGAVAAAVAAGLGEPLERVALVARGALAAKIAELEPETAGEDALREASRGDPSAQPTAAGPPVRSVRLAVTNRLGLHMRSAALFVRTAAAYDADVTVTDLTSGRGPAEARSLSAVATLGVRQGDEILVQASGPQAGEALAAIERLAAEGWGDAPDAASPEAPALVEARPQAGAVGSSSAGAVVACPGEPGPSVLVTFAADEPARAVIEDVLGDVASVQYLHDVADGERRSALAGADVLLFGDIGDALTADEWTALAAASKPAASAAKSLPAPARLIQLVSAGVDHVPFERIPPGVLVAGNAGGWAEPMAEHVLAMMLALAKRLLPEHDELRRGGFSDRVPTRELRGGTCAIVGFGGIGRAVAPLVRALGMKVMALNTSGATGVPADFIGTLADLNHVLRLADVVVLTLPLTAASRGLIGARELGCMRRGAILVNVARAPIVDEAALYRHLCANAGFSAAFDVWWHEPSGGEPFTVGHPFFELPNFLGSPHNSGIVDGWFEFGLRRAVLNVRRHVLGRPVAGLARADDYLT